MGGLKIPVRCRVVVSWGWGEREAEENNVAAKGSGDWGGGGIGG